MYQRHSNRVTQVGTLCLDVNLDPRLRQIYTTFRLQCETDVTGVAGGVEGVHLWSKNVISV